MEEGKVRGGEGAIYSVRSQREERERERISFSEIKLKIPGDIGIAIFW